MKILNFGSLNLDYVYQVDHMVSAGETLNSESLNLFCGGKGLNQSIALARAGAEVYHAGCIGSEGSVLRDVLAGAGVHSELVRQIQGRTGHTIIQVDPKGENCILLYGGANRCMTKDYVDKVLACFGEGDLLLLQNEINLVDYIIEEGYKRGMRIVLNPSPFDAKLENCDLRKVSLFLLNETEGWQMTGERELKKILSALRQMYPEAQLVLTLGASGAVYLDKNMRCHQPAYPAKAVDTTGAGDTFTGYFVTGMTEGLTPEECLKLAAKAASIAITRRGAAPSIPYREEVGHMEARDGE